MNDWLNHTIQPISVKFKTRAQARQQQLTKPPGSLGRLEDIAVQLAAIQQSDTPSAERIDIHIFAADHGVAAEGVSAFPQAVTGEMIRNFSRGGAAISVLAKQLNAELCVHNLGTINATGIEDETLAGVTHYRLGPGTENFCTQAAMSEQQLNQALQVGKHAAEKSAEAGTQILIAGEMGIANTSSATALACALLHLSPAQLAGPGTGLNTQGVAHKVAVIERALSLHAKNQSPLDILRALGGFEIAALVGFYLRAAQLSCATLIDGFICSAAALVASRINPSCGEYFLLSHNSAEPGHQIIAEALQLQPLLDLQLRLGEGSGAAVAANLLRAACATHNQMATFAEAEVSNKDAR